MNIFSRRIKLKRIGIIMAAFLLFTTLAADCGKVTPTMTPSMTTTTITTQTSLSTTTETSGLNSASTESVNGLSLSLSTDRTT